jgi:2-polyprenyl-3-methyl-5-hydroxy-6-metoxy-1,4-benzoquinol methylase
MPQQRDGCQADVLADRSAHWRDVYAHRAVTDVSWFKQNPAPSIELIHVIGARTNSSIIDVGGGASTLVDRLLDEGYPDITVLDIAETAVALARSRLGQRARRVS